MGLFLHAAGFRLCGLGVKTMKLRTAAILFAIMMVDLIFTLSFSIWGPQFPKESMWNAISIPIIAGFAIPVFLLYCTAPDISDRWEMESPCRECRGPVCAEQDGLRIRVECLHCGKVRRSKSAWSGYPSIGDY